MITGYGSVSQIWWNTSGQFDGQEFPDQTPLSGALTPWLYDDVYRPVRRQIRRAESGDVLFAPSTAAPPAVVSGWEVADPIAKRKVQRNGGVESRQEAPGPVISMLLAQPGWEIPDPRAKPKIQRNGGVEARVDAPGPVISMLLALPGWEEYSNQPKAKRPWFKAEPSPLLFLPTLPPQPVTGWEGDTPRIPTIAKHRPTLAVSGGGAIPPLPTGWEEILSRVGVRKKTVRQDDALLFQPTVAAATPVVSGWEIPDPVRRKIQRNGGVESRTDAPGPVISMLLALPGWEEYSVQPKAKRPWFKAEPTVFLAPLSVIAQLLALPGWEDWNVPARARRRGRVAVDDATLLPAPPLVWIQDDVPRKVRVLMRRTPPAISGGGATLPLPVGWEELPSKVIVGRKIRRPGDVTEILFVPAAGPQPVVWIQDQPAPLVFRKRLQRGVEQLELVNIVFVPPPGSGVVGYFKGRDDTTKVFKGVFSFDDR